MSDHLRQFAPKVDERYTNPEFETDWHDVLLDLGIASLKSGITSVLTIGSGRGDVFGAWTGLGVELQGHNLGHVPQPDNPIWIKIRQYNCRMLVKIIEALESVPEGSGTMMDAVWRCRRQTVSAPAFVLCATLRSGLRSSPTQ